MITLEEVTQINERYGDPAALATFVRKLAQGGVVTSDTYVVDGHESYTGAMGQVLETSATYAPLEIASTTDKGRFERCMASVTAGTMPMMDMLHELAASGVKKWTFDTAAETITYFDTAGNVLLSEQLVDEYPTADEALDVA